MDTRQASAEIWREAFSVFEHLLALEAPRREQELRGLRTSRPDLYPHVLTLLGADRSAEVRSFLAGDAITDAGAGAARDSSALEPRARFGAYQLERPLGAGGMGEVWLARRIDGRFEGVAAVKILHAHLAQSSARERFLREGNILGQLSHPLIARLLDAGVTPTGVLYLVLEYVEGERIDRWCDEQRLDIPARLHLFLQVCTAVAHAHAHLVVHRDLKPPNILVTTAGEIKLLDFGVAKLVELEKSAEETELTRLGGRALTPDYAAPEQVLGQPVTTATDVYALGVLLYGLLSGRRPFDRQHMTPRELEHDVLEAEPASLSRGAVAYDNASEMAKQRSTTPQRLKHLLAGDLETIVAKTLCIEPERRYATVEQLSADVGRYLAGRPVVAARDTWRYRTRKFVTRHLFGVTATTAAVLLLAGFAVAMYVQAERIARERSRAEQVSSFLVDLFESSDPYKSRGADIKARELLDVGARRVKEGFASQVETRAILMETIGRVYNRLGLAGDARPLLESALQGLIRVHGRDHPSVADALNELGNALAGQGDTDGAELRLRDALAMRQKLFGADAVEVAATLTDLGRLALQRGSVEEAERFYRNSLDLYTRRGVRDSPGAADVMNELASLRGYVGRNDEAAALYRAALEIDRRTLGDDHPQVIKETHNLAFVLQAQGLLSEAEPLFIESNERMHRVLGAEHPDRIDALSNFGRFLRRKGDYERAEIVLRDVLELNRRVRGVNSDSVGASHIQLALLLHDSGKLAEAEAEHRAGLKIYEQVLPRNHPFVVVALAGLGRVLIDLKREAEATPLLTQAVEIASASMPNDSHILAIARSSLGSALVALHRYDQAEPLLRNNYSMLARTQGEHAAVTRQAREALEELDRVTKRTMQ